MLCVTVITRREEGQVNHFHFVRWSKLDRSSVTARCELSRPDFASVSAKMRRRVTTIARPSTSLKYFFRAELMPKRYYAHNGQLFSRPHVWRARLNGRFSGASAYR
jgi:hypothetical protein